MFFDVSPSGLMRLFHSTHGLRRGLRSAALRAEELPSDCNDFRYEMAE